ncbi:lipocalin-like domain-containing protein [Chryseolinea soli]|uniref:Lipocalin-like domain-containing protein n=1 Tax=Chryseolinea soli TaxID=2321403 RepID=A0A385SNA0_9BACT|nr:lipocalin-like domain-containing protein [Chryseolinea soli]AYB30930.1 hypothetical protein D4L85_10220 [Chryseolinea soli]
MTTSVSSTASLAAMQGIWWLISREDYTKDGQRRIDPVLGSDPMGILSYAKDRFSAQFMKRDRTEGSNKQVFTAGQNNTSAAGGYDAYFGTYAIDNESGKVAHTLMGSITPSNVGMTVYRDLKVSDDRLVIQLETTTLEGEEIVRTLVWERIS